MQHRPLSVAELPRPLGAGSLEEATVASQPLSLRQPPLRKTTHLQGMKTVPRPTALFSFSHTG